MDKLKVLVTDAIDAEGLKSLERHPGIDLRYEISPPSDKLEKALKGVGAWLVRSETKVTGSWIDKARDLRLIGRFLRSVPAAEVLHDLRPWMLAGFALSFASGILLFSAEAVAVVQSPAFPFKVLFILLAAANAIYFELRLRAGGARVALAGATSLTLWLLVVATGRLIPYLTSW